MNVYVTVTELKQYLGASLFENPLADADEEDALMRFCVQASRLFDAYVSNGTEPKRKFYPTIETRNFDHPVRGFDMGPEDSSGYLLAPVRQSSAVLYLDQDLVALSSLTTKNGSITVSLGDVITTSYGNPNVTPYSQLRLDPDGTYTVFEWQNTEYAANAVTGTWCWHDAWSDAWEDSGDTVEDNPLSDSATTITVNDVDGDDINGLSYRFKKQQLIQVESEIMWITGIDPSNEQLTVRRGMNGSTAASHVQNTTISVFKPVEDIVNALWVLAARLYKRRDTVDDSSQDRPVMTPHGVILTTQALPAEVKAILNSYMRESL